MTDEQFKQLIGIQNKIADRLLPIYIISGMAIVAAIVTVGLLATGLLMNLGQ